MAVTTAGRLLTDAHRAGQARLAARLTTQLISIWPLIDPRRIDATAGRWLTAAAPLVRSAYVQSQALGVAYFDQLRRVELVDPAPFAPLALDTIPDAQIRTSLLTTGPLRIKGAPSLLDASRSALTTSTASANRLALAGGRAAITAHTEADPLAHGTRRVTRPGCCAFCAVLAVRSIDGLSSDYFQAHDNCMCQPEPAWATGEGQNATARDLHDIYREATANGGGLNEFRRALDASRT